MGSPRHVFQNLLIELIRREQRVQNDIAKVIGGDRLAIGPGQDVANLQPMGDVKARVDRNDAVFFRRIACPPEDVTRSAANFRHGAGTEVSDLKAAVSGGVLPGGQSPFRPLGHAEFRQCDSAGVDRVSAIGVAVVDEVQDLAAGQRLAAVLAGDVDARSAIPAGDDSQVSSTLNGCSRNSTPSNSHGPSLPLSRSCFSNVARYPWTSLR